MTPYRILIIDDDRNLSDVVALNLRQAGYEVLQAHSGEKGVEVALSGHPDLVLLDVALPDADGFEVCRRIRAEAYTPIIFLSGKTHETDVITGLAVGGDSYIKKPFEIPELVALVKAVLRRSKEYPEAAKAKVLRIQDLVVDPGKFELRLSGRTVPLSATEFRLLEYLARNVDLVLSREQLLENVWGFKTDGLASRTVDVAVARLRKKMADDSDHPRYIQTVPGVGYRLNA